MKSLSFGGLAGDISTFGVEFYEKFDAVVISYCSLAKKVLDYIILDGSYCLLMICLSICFSIF